MFEERRGGHGYSDLRRLDLEKPYLNMLLFLVGEIEWIASILNLSRLQVIKYCGPI
jgi:hypothetical protein